MSPRKTRWTVWVLTLPQLLVGLPLGLARASILDEVRSAPVAHPLLRQSLICGPNSLYMLLALHGVSVDHRVIEKYIPSDGEGMSLAELKEASNVLGLRTGVRRCSIDELHSEFQSPVIAHLVNQRKHHYVIVIDMTPDTVTMIDGTTGEMDTVNSQSLKKIWSGYLLMVENGFPASSLILQVSLFGWMLIGLCTLKGLPRRKNR